MRDFKIPIIPEYQLRFLTEEQYHEGIKYYHLARAALCGKGKIVTQHDQLCYASKWLVIKYNIKPLACYKDLYGKIIGL